MSIADLAPHRYPLLWRWIIERVWRVEHAFERAHADGRAENDTRIRIFVVLAVFAFGFVIMSAGAVWSSTVAVCIGSHIFRYSPIGLPYRI